MPLTFPTAAELFHGTTDAEAQKIARLCNERRYPQGRTIFSKDDPADALYIVREGLVKLLSHSEKGTETILLLLKPDTIFGELLVSEARRAFTAVAATDAVVTVISRPAFLEILSAAPTVSRNFIRLLSERLAKAERTIAEFGHTWSYHRLAHVLLQLAEEHGEKTPAGTRITLRVTHEDLANLIGTTRETVTTRLGKFAKMGYLKREGRRLVLNVPKLSRIARASSPM